MFKNSKILQSIKDGSAIAGKYDFKKVIFKKPNVLIVFFQTKHLIWISYQKIGGKYSKYQKILKIEIRQWCGKIKENGFLASMDEDYVYEGSDSEYQVLV